MPKPTLKNLLKGKSKTSNDKESSQGRGENSDIDPRGPSISHGYSISSRSCLDANSGTGGATGGQPPRNPYIAGGATGGQPPRNPYIAGGGTGGQPPRNPYIAGGATGGQPPRNPYIAGGATGGQPLRNPYIAGGATGGILKTNLDKDKSKKGKKVHFACSEEDFEELEIEKRKNKHESKDMFLASLTQLCDIAREKGSGNAEEEILRHNNLAKSIDQKKDDLRDIYNTIFGNQSYPPPIEVDNTPYPKYPLEDRESLLDRAHLKLTGSRDHYHQQMDMMFSGIMESGISEGEAREMLMEDPEYFKLQTAYNRCVVKLAELPDK